MAHLATAAPAIALLAGVLALYAPTYHELALTLWQTEAQSHAPLIALVSAWLLWQRRGDLLRGPAVPANLSGVALLTLGLATYVVGRSQQIALLEVASQIPVLAGILLLVRGTQALRVAALPLLFLAFMIPLPGILVEAATGTLKEWASLAVEEILFRAGLPVARSGVVLTLGQYQLLVADACSGLHSMISLSALGLLFLHLAGRQSLLHNGLLAAAILPVAFAANVLRVLVLALVTYHFGDAAGRGIVHEVTGLAVFAVALALLFAFDALLAGLPPQRQARPFAAA